MNVGNIDNVGNDDNVDNVGNGEVQLAAARAVIVVTLQNLRPLVECTKL